MDTRGQRQIAAGMKQGTHLPVTSRLKQEVPCCYVLTPICIAHLPLACSLQGYHGVIHDNLAGSP